MLFSTLFLVACSENNIIVQESSSKVDDPKNVEGYTEVYVPTQSTTDTDPSGVGTMDVPEDSNPDGVETDTDTDTGTDLEPTEDPCATTQVISTGLWDDTDGDGDRELVYAEVYAKPIFSHLGEDAMEVTQGEESPFDLVVTNQCSAIRIWNLFYLIDDDDLDGEGWLYDINEERMEAGYLSEYSTGEEFSPIAAINLDWGTTSDELQYEWCSEDVGTSPCTDMGDPREIGADETELYPFEFTATDYAPVGTIFQEMIVSVVWEDVATGTVVWDYSYDIVDVTVVE